MKRLPWDNLPGGLLLVIAAWALALGTHIQWYAFLVTAVLATHLVFGLRLPIKPTAVVQVLLTLPFAFWYRQLPVRGFTGFAPVDMLFMIGFYAVAMGSMHLLTSRTGGNRDQACGLAIAAFALAGSAPPSRKFSFLVIAFIPLVLLQIRLSLGMFRITPAAKQGRKYLLALGLTVLVTCVLQYGLIRYMTGVNHWLAGRMLTPAPVSSAGFNRVTNLSDITRVWQEGRYNEIVLRQWAHAQPVAEYLRGAVYDQYNQGKWSLIEEANEVIPQGSDQGRHIFNLVSLPTDLYLTPQATLYPSREYASTFFLPLGVRRISAFDNKVLTSFALTVYSPEKLALAGYGYYETYAVQTPPTPNDLTLPANLRTPLQNIAHKALASGGGLPGALPGAKAGRLAQMFQKEFTYSLSFAPRKQKDPVLEFLEDSHTGHCEYFASAAVLLLRAMGVPARYVTGFVCREKGIGGVCWYSRRKDAHAWVEIYDPVAGWQTFDPTPASAQLQVTTQSTGEGWLDLLAAYWNRLMSVAMYGGVIGLLALVWSGLVSLVAQIPVWVWGITALLLVVWLYRRNIMHLWNRRRGEKVSSQVSAWRARLRTVEKRLVRYGLVREPGTTVGAFCQRVQMAKVPQPVKEQALAVLYEYQRARFKKQM